MIVSVHLADVGKPAALGLLRTKLDPAAIDGLRYAETTIAAPLSGGLLPRVNLGRAGLIAAWDEDRALDGFLENHPLADRLRHGWHVRLRPTRLFGSWSKLAGLLGEEEPMDEEEPTVVLTLGRLRLSQAGRFVRAGAAAQGHALRQPALLAATGLARPPSLVATFSVWRNTAGMRAYVEGHSGDAHAAAMRANAAKGFHHESAFVRFRPYAAQGEWDGRNPLAVTQAAPAAA
jgi:hypothetical protein